MRSSYVNKLVKLMTFGGNKQKSEHIILKSFKKLNKVSLNQPYDLLQLAVKKLIPLYRFKVKKNKKQAEFIINPSSRITLAVKYITKVLGDKKNLKAYYIVSNEILQTCFDNSKSLNLKLDDQKQVIAYKKSINRYYRW